jgi:hypothetical protein
MNLMLIAPTLLLASVSLAAEPSKATLPRAATRSVDFARDVRPILAASCFSCHGPQKQRGGLRLDDGAAALKGGDGGPVLKPGDAAGSRLLLAVAGLDPDLKMPPENKTPLNVEQIGVLRAWIEQGAKWTGPAGAVVAAKSTHWAFQPIRRPPLPRVVNKGWVKNEIDAFVLARLEKEKFAPAPEADRATLLRRLCLDLLGLPPAPEELDAFLTDTRPDAYERLVDRLLASPHYGERWGRHWLDLARYADSDGYEKDNPRPHAWRYRDWVISALNRDLPFDQFTIEQLAGDLLPGATVEQMTATGFHRQTLTNTEGGADQEQFRVEACVDRVNTTAKVFLGITLNCCQCHDHKYDPFAQREYYQFLAFFNSDNEVNVPVSLPGHEAEDARRQAEYTTKLAGLKAAIKSYRGKELATIQRQWETELKLPELRSVPAKVRDVLLVEPDKRSAAQQKDLADYYATIDRKLRSLAYELTAFQKAAPQLPLAMTLALGPGRKTQVMIRGDFLRPGVAVEPATPAVLGSFPPAAKPTRLDLARWIVSPANPLTARVTVNWVWQKYFGRGLVPTLEDFGTKGDPPSHPELLDWLASDFHTRNWSLKALHRLIVTSATYRQASKARPELAARDPLNVLLARQARVRLEAEVVRDVALASSGLLVRTVGGPSVRPPQPAGVSELTYGGGLKWAESKGPDRFRRGLYTWFQRTSPYPMLMTFDAPDANLCCVRRDRSNTPLQALTLMNDTAFVECAQELGRRLVQFPAEGPSARVRHGFRLCVGRDPTAVELERLTRLWEELRSLCQANPMEAAKLAGTVPSGANPADAAAWAALGRALLNLDEVVTRE